MTIEELRVQFERTMPPVFAATELDRLTGNALRWNTLQNRRASKKKDMEKPPETCFLQDGCRKILIVRDELLKWWLMTLTTAASK